jgi:hypothetical protein
MRKLSFEVAAHYLTVYFVEQPLEKDFRGKKSPKSGNF